MVNHRTRIRRHRECIAAQTWAALQSSLSAAQADVQSLVSGTVTQVSLGQIGGQSVYLDINSLALIDQVFFAYYLGSTQPRPR